MTRAEIKELLKLVNDAHKTFKANIRELITIQQGMIAAVAALATALNKTIPEDPAAEDAERN
jgi:hypothetical protein